MARQLLIDSPVFGTIVVTVDDDGAVSRVTFGDEPAGVWRKRLLIAIEGER